MGNDDDPVTSGPAPTLTPTTTSASFRSQLTPGEDVVDPATWAGSVPQVNGIAPRVRVGRDAGSTCCGCCRSGSCCCSSRWRSPRACATTRRCSSSSSLPRHRRLGAPRSDDGVSGLGGWQHFFNLFLMIFIIRSGVQILTDHPRLYWTRHSHPGTGVVPDPEAGADRSAVDGQAGLDQPAAAGRPAGASALHRPGSLVASGRRHALAAERPRLLRPAVHHRSLAAAGARRAGTCSPTLCRW